MKSENNKSQGIDDQAAEWVLKNDHGLTAAEQDAFTDWLSEREEHRAAYAEHRFAWAEMARLAGLQNTDYAPVVSDLLGIEQQPWYRKFRKIHYLSAAIGVAASILITVGLLFLSDTVDQSVPADSNHVLVFNHIKQQQLEDGSVVDLNMGAATQVDYSREQRLVKLISGEANFKVRKDPSRPFIVEAAGIQLRALGTVFNVRMDDEVIDMVVTEGTVAVQPLPGESESGNQSPQEALVRRNFRAIIDLRPEIPQVTVNPVNEADLNAELLWQPRLIDFENAPLTRIVDEFNRRNPLQLVIQDGELGSLRFTSIFWSHNVESFVRLLEANYGVTAEPVSDNRILLKKPPTAL